MTICLLLVGWITVIVASYRAAVWVLAKTDNL